MLYNITYIYLRCSIPEEKERKNISTIDKLVAAREVNDVSKTKGCKEKSYNNSFIFIKVNNLQKGVFDLIPPFLPSYHLL
jgi:hypothetical protein